MGIRTEDFDYIRNLVRQRSAIVLEPGKEYLVESRMLSLLAREKFPSIEDLVRELRFNSQNGLVDRVVDALTTNETSFFRDIYPFEVLRENILPEIIQARKSTKELNIWCGASSSGQEPYTIALILNEHFPQLIDWKINFVASDISVEMLDRCRRGAFSQLEVNRGLPASLLVKHFERQGMEWFIKEKFRKMIQFKQINLSQRIPLMPNLDIVFLRNVLIYFDIPTKKKILGQIRELLRPDGVLFLGGAESTLNLDTAYERMQFKQSGCYRLKGGTS